MLGILIVLFGIMLMLLYISNNLSRIASAMKQISKKMGVQE